MRELGKLTKADLAGLKPGEKLLTHPTRSRHFENLHPTHASASQLNDVGVIQLYMMEMASAAQVFEVTNVDEDGNPTIVTAGVETRPPSQVEIGQIHARAGTLAQIAALMLRQALDMDEAAAKAEAEKQCPGLKDRL